MWWSVTKQYFIEAIRQVRMQYGCALEFRYFNVYSTIGPGNFLIIKMHS